jgi:hypothetical protein
VSCWFAHAIPWFTRPAPSSVAGISMPSALAVFRLMAGPMPLDVSVGSIATKIDHSGHFRLSLNSGSTEDIAVGPVRASNRHEPRRGIKARLAPPSDPS